jgi:PST family polysaccharide transporter
MNDLQRRVRALMNHSLARNSAFLYGVQICRKIFPLIMIPYLARVLRAEGWGTVAFVQSLADIVALVIEFGFNLSATREVSRGRNDRARCGQIMAGVLGAQALLSTSALTLVFFLAPHLSLLRENPAMLTAACVYAVAQGFAPLWFFQGLERMATAAGLEIFARLCALAGIFLFVHNADDGWKVLSLQAFTAGVSTVAGIGLAFRTFGFRMPSPPLVLNALRKGWPMFVFRSAESLYGVGNSFVLGLFAAPVTVGYFAIAEKISKAIFGLLNPVREALYPRLSYLMESSERAAARLARIGIAIMTITGLVLSATILFFARDLIRLLAGRGFAHAVPVLRIMGFLPFVLSITYSVGLQWLLPLGRDMVVNRIIICGGVLNLCLAFALASRFGAIGMACSVLSAELFVCGSFLWIVCRSTSLWEGTAILASFRRNDPTATVETMAGEY